MLELAERTEERYELVERIHDIGEDKNGIFLHVEWAGLPDKRDPTWVSADDMYADVPDLTTEFVKSKRGWNRLIKRAVATLPKSL